MSASTGSAVGPDFIVIGARKAATTWLYKYAEALPSVAMPAVKELNFFNQQSLWVDGARSLAISELVEKWTKRHNVRADDIRRPLGPIKPTSTIEDAFDWYRAMFTNLRAQSGRPHSGDISPLYQNLPLDRLQRMAAELPQTQIVYVLRHPVDRVWSDFVMEFVVNGGLDPDAMRPEAIVDLIFSRTIRGGMYAEVIPRWRSAFGDRFHLMIFDDLKVSAEDFGRQFAEHVGVEYVPGCAEVTRNPNPGRKVVCPEEVRDALSHFFVPDIAEAQRLMSHPTLNAWALDLTSRSRSTS